MMEANRPSACSDQELKLMVRIFDARDYEQRRGRYDNPIEAKRAIVDEVIHTIRDSIGVDRTVGQIQRNWSFLRYTVPQRLQRLRGEIRQEQRHLRCGALPASPPYFVPLAHQHEEQQALLPVRDLPQRRAPAIQNISHSPILVWIMGHSYVARGAVRAAALRDGQQLGLPCQELTVTWRGRGGMKWPQFLPDFEQFVALQQRWPHILLIHLGGNDVGAVSWQEIVRWIKRDLIHLWTCYPNMVTVWSEIVPRNIWRGARSVSRLNRARIKINREVADFMQQNGALAVRHPELESSEGAYWLRDGIHLNDAGMDIWFSDLKSGIENATRMWRDAR